MGTRDNIKLILREELTSSDEARIKKLARDEFDKSIKKHLSSSQFESKIKELVIKNLKKVNGEDTKKLLDEALGKVDEIKTQFPDIKSVTAQEARAIGESKFEVGKWYKNYGNIEPHYMKCSNFDNSYLYGNEYIITKTKLHQIKGTRDCNWSWGNVGPVLLTDLSEISQYLPDDHPDKL